jgi:hypothetical protein
MARGNSQKTANGSAFDFEAQLWAAAQGVPAPDCNRRKWWPCASTMSDWGGENLRQDVRCKFGLPPVNNANYAWIEHFSRKGNDNTLKA